MRLRKQGRKLCRRTTLTTLLFLAGASASAAQTEACPNEMAMKAESEASTLETWQAVLASYKKYKQCDDGAIADGYSSSIAILLADHWDDIDELARLNNHNTEFRKFVLHHVDETMSFDQAAMIKKNITEKCPSEAKALCAEIQRRFAADGF